MLRVEKVLSSQITTFYIDTNKHLGFGLNRMHAGKISRFAYFYEVCKIFEILFWKEKNRMKKILLTILMIGIVAFLAYWGADTYRFSNAAENAVVQLENSQPKEKIQNGDIIFQTSKSSQSKAIQLATNSKYSHMGIIYENDGKYFVYEAVQPVKLTPLADWVARGQSGHYVVKRLKNADKILTESVFAKMKRTGQQFKGKSYDIYFEWSDDKIYCSELVWKMYKEATGIEIGTLEKLSDFDLSSAIVQAKMKERYGEKLPMNEKVISPASMFNSEKLITIAKK